MPTCLKWTPHFRAESTALYVYRSLIPKRTPIFYQFMSVLQLRSRRTEKKIQKKVFPPVSTSEYELFSIWSAELRCAKQPKSRWFNAWNRFLIPCLINSFSLHRVKIIRNWFHRHLASTHRERWYENNKKSSKAPTTCFTKKKYLTIHLISSLEHLIHS